MILRSCEASKRTAVAVMTSLPLVDGVEKSLAAHAADRLRAFRGEARHDREPCLVAERGEERRCAREPLRRSP